MSKALSLLIFIFIFLPFRVGAEEASTVSASPESKDPAAFSLPTSGSVKMSHRELPPRSTECQLCHTRKSRVFIKKEYQPVREHEGITSLHGKRKMSCNMCHDLNNHNYLLNTKHYPADFNNPSFVCGRCHVERLRDWRRGLHGKRMGGWNLEKTQLHCIDCHQPHSVRFPPMEALPPEKQTPHVIPKLHEEDLWQTFGDEHQDVKTNKGSD